jgi:hypothetical protein
MAFYFLAGTARGEQKMAWEDSASAMTFLSRFFFSRAVYFPF